VTDTGVTADGPVAPVVPAGEPGLVRRYAMVVVFLAPATVMLGVWIVYPTVYTIVRSLFGQSGFNDFVGVHNYRTLFSDSGLRTAIKNNAIWVAVIPALVTSIGLVFAVLIERIRWSVAFRLAVFMPMAISLFAAGVIWRLQYQQDPNLGAINAGITAVKSAFTPTGVLSTASPSTKALSGDPQTTGLVLKAPLHRGSVALLGVTAINVTEIPKTSKQAVKPAPVANGITGVVWRDFKPGGGKPGVLEPGEAGLPGVTVELRDASGHSVATAKTADNGDFAFPNVSSGTYHAAIGPSTFAKPYGGVGWLTSNLITPAIMIAYLWVWAGFAMVVIAAGLAAIPRDVLEAARTDGAAEWQVFRRVTVPLLAPVLTVVFITMIINVLKVFDIVLAIAPESVQPNANVIALAMWRTSFGGVNDFGLGSAIAVLLFALVVPVLLLNVRRFRREV
jgi:alpha-glucoside transport system permease protein